MLARQSRVHLAVRDGHARKVGVAYETAHWRGHGVWGERSRLGGTESENTGQALEFQRRKLTASCCFHEALLPSLLS